MNKILLGLLAILLSPCVNAYIGPGPATTFIGASIGWLCAIVFSLLVILSWPLRVVYRKCQKRFKKCPELKK